MKRDDPPLGGGSGDTRLRVAGERPHTRSDARRASLTSQSSKSLLEATAPGRLLANAALAIVLRAKGRSRFDVLFGETTIVQSSTQPICKAARVLHRLGYSDDYRLVASHEGSDHHAISGRLGYWRKRRVREDRGLPRYVAWESRPRRVGAKKSRRKFKGVERGGKKKNASTTTPGAHKGHSTVPQVGARSLREQL
jgi:hypothetical protein